MIKKIFGNVILATAIGLVSGAFAATIDLSKVTGNTTFNNGDVITGTLGADVELSIADGAYVTLRNVTIDRGHNSSCPWAGLTCLGDAEIRVDGENTVKGFYNASGIHVPAGNTLTIRQAVNISGYAALGGGTLTVGDAGLGAGIGAGNGIPCGNIVIESGIINCMLSLPRNMFYTVTLPATLWFFDKARMDDKHILFIDARNIFRQIDRAHREFTPEQIRNIACIRHLYQGDTDYMVQLLAQYDADIDALEKEYSEAAIRHVEAKVKAEEWLAANTDKTFPSPV